jgi:hypothetical protein
LALGATAWRYLASVLGSVGREHAHWRARVREIPDLALAANARASLSKRGNMEGAALFAVLVPASRRRETLRALVAFQTAYNYLDTLCEQPSADPVANGRQLHRGRSRTLVDGLHPVRVPSTEEAALRDLVRARENVRGDLMRARHRMSKLLLRHDITFDGPGRSWSVAHRQWLGRLELGDRGAQVMLLDPARRSFRVRPVAGGPRGPVVARLRASSRAGARGYIPAPVSRRCLPRRCLD